VWAPRGIKVNQKVEFEGKWLYLNLAVNGKSGRLRWAWSENMKSETIAGVLGGWGKEGVKVVVWARAPGHHGKGYEGVHVQRIEQPPYSSELNPAERVFEPMRAQTEDLWVIGSEESGSRSGSCRLILRKSSVWRVGNGFSVPWPQYLAQTRSLHK
jgi:hypothetical protein